MNKTLSILLSLFLLAPAFANAQGAKINMGPKTKPPTDKEILKSLITSLAAPEMHGRGYVKGGKEDASKFIQKKFKDFKLKPVPKEGAKEGTGTYVQGYFFPVNTFPGKMSLTLNKTELTPGEDYIIDAASPSFTGEDLEFEDLDLGNATDTAGWIEATSKIDENHIYLVSHIDSACQFFNIKKERFAYCLPKGCYILPTKKLTWTVSRDTTRATVFYVKPDAMPKTLKTASVIVNAEFIPKVRNENIIGMVQGAVKDTFIAFSAHYDHLGMMGDTTLFPGASDNASGTAMLLYLAAHFALEKTKPHYSMLFIAFSGEEAGLMGSQFYSAFPQVPFNKIKFLTNIDIMGDATAGITVVNAPGNPKEFELMEKINDTSSYRIPIASRDNTSNSDHYYFTKAGVPAFFIYSNGGKGYYHDIYDKAENVTLNHVDDVAKLLITFAKTLD